MYDINMHNGITDDGSRRNRTPFHGSIKDYYYNNSNACDNTSAPPPSTHTYVGINRVNTFLCVVKTRNLPSYTT